jgi:predicted ATPase/class 3 adenylate cyclase
MTKELPTGTATFLFSDIEGSTRLVQGLGERYQELLAAHHLLLRRAFAEHGGHELRTEGDAFFMVFGSANSAVAAAVAAQRALASHPWPPGAAIRVRMGIHSGEAQRMADDYVGLDVHRAARIAAAGAGGQVLVSDVVRSLVEQALPDSVGLRDLGAHRLKDLARPEHLFQVDIAGLPGDFPPLAGLDATPNNLPTQLTSFVGREAELAEAKRLLERTHLLTLTGPGGTGKTRLSLQLAAEVASTFPQGVYFVPLAPVRDAELVSSTILQMLGVADGGTRPPLDRLLDYVRDKHVLLVLDNFEQLLAAAPLVSELLKAGPGVKSVVTSRAVLRVYGEQEFAVPPLRLADPKALPGLEALSQFESIRLFIERAAAVKPDFRVTNENAPAVAGICERVDGLPLAIELAAARIKVFTPQALLARLETCLGMLSSGSRDLPGRQQTLRGAITWSYDLLDDGGRRLLARFAVFARGASLEQAEAICGPAEEIGAEVLDGLVSLVDQSLLRQESLTDESRFLMLQTIREFAWERLAASGAEAALIQQRHAAAFLALAERAQPELTGPRQKEWLDRLDRDHDNFRAALDWCAASGAAPTAFRLAAALWRFWQMRGHLHEARQRMGRVLAIPGGREHSRERARALEAAGGIAYWQGDMAAAQPFYQESLEICKELGDKPMIANALYNLAFVFTVTRIDLARGESLLTEALGVYRELEDRPGTAKALWGIGQAAFLAGDHVTAQTVLEESLALLGSLQDRFSLGWVLHTLGLSYVRTTQLDRGRAALEESLQIFAQAHDVSGIVLLLDDFAELADAEGDPQRAIRLTGAARALTASSGVTLATAVNPSLERVPPDQREAAWAEGQAMTVEQAVAYALEPPAPPSATP